MKITGLEPLSSSYDMKAETTTRTCGFRCMAGVEARQRDGFGPRAVGGVHDAPAAIVHTYAGFSLSHACWFAGKLTLYKSPRRYVSSRRFIACVITLISRSSVFYIHQNFTHSEYNCIKSKNEVFWFESLLLISRDYLLLF